MSFELRAKQPHIEDKISTELLLKDIDGEQKMLMSFMNKVNN
jgi:hypothetical protein